MKKLKEQEDLDNEVIETPIDIPVFEHNKEEEKEDQHFPGSILSQLEPVQKERHLKPDALEHDIRLGWVPRSQITGPIPLSFSHENFDWVIQNKIKSVIYLGFRPNNTFQMHQRYYGEGKNYPFYQFHLCKAKFLDRFFKKYYSDYIFQGRQAKTIQQSELSFDSYYQGGNLDAVYYEQNEYCLMLRVDSNTLGHCNYYNFKVKPSKSGKFKFRIMNMSKWKSLYQRGMRPYVRKIKNGLASDFQQSGTGIKFTDSPLCEQFELKPLKSLKFQYQFDQPNVLYQFSYSIPYTYSQLYTDIRSEKTNNYLHISKLCHSLSGVEIPLLTITSTDRDDSNDTFVIAVIGRIHPSEATGSHIVNGLIKQLTSESSESKWLRNKVIFKIVPMLNPDGVIMGNTRTGVAGKDLNRQYRKNSDFVFPEVNAIIDYMTKLKQKYGKKLLYLLDIHGHSTRKNSFFFGPQYSIMDEEYVKSRLLPKIFASRTEVFRYYSCKFKVSSLKETTARGYFNNNGIRTYTHETSAHCFFDFEKRNDKAFTRDSLEELGRQLSLSLHDYVKIVVGKESIPLLPQPEKKVRKIIKLSPHQNNQPEEDEVDSDKMSSNKDDSEDDGEDFQQRKMAQFFSKINENRQYFYEELVAEQKGESQIKISKKQQKKSRKNSILKSEESKISEPRINKMQIDLEEQLLVQRKLSEKKIDWAAKVIYPQKKKIQIQYPKLSSVIFGSSIPEYFFHSHNSTENNYLGNRQNSESSNFENTTKYTVNCIEAEFKSTEAKYPSPQHKVQKALKPLKKEGSLRDVLRQKKDPVAIKLSMDKKTQQRYLKLKEELLPSPSSPSPSPLSQSPQFNYRTTIRQTFYGKAGEYQSVRPIPVRPVEMVTNDKKEEEKEIMRMTTSLKVLTRKKSIKNIRQSQSVQTRKISKSLKINTLTRRLPSLGSLYINS